MPSYRFLLDGVETEVEADPKASVLDVLRETLGVYVVKAGCAPQGLCGCCTVLVDGKARLTCTLPVKSIAEKAITTLAGVLEADRAVVAESLAACEAAPCGYCTPGIALSTVALLQANTSPSDDELHRALAPHTCRCTGYAGILEGMRQAAAVKRGERERVAVNLDDMERVTGERPFVDDLVRPGMLHAVPIFAAVARGTVTTLELPEGGRSLVLRGVGRLVGHAGEAVALLAAPTMAEARALAAAVKLEVTPCPAELPAPVARARRRDGDVDTALAACVHRAEIDLSFAPTDTVPLEPEAALAVPTLDGIVLYTACRDAETVARACPGATRIEPMSSGGDGGVKDLPQVEPWAVALAEATGKPVRISLDHAEGTRIRPRRPGARVRGVAGCDGAGRLVALRLVVEIDGGVVAHAADRAVAQALGAVAYDIEHVDVTVEVVTSERSATGPAWGAGAYPVTVAVEALVEQLAVATAADPLAFRLAMAGTAAPLLASLREAYEAHPGARGLGLSRVEGVELQRAAHLAILDEGGAVRGLYAAADGDGQWLAGATAAGLGLALAEEVGHADGMPETRFRYLGTLKSKLTPPIHARGQGGGAHEAGECLGGAAAAVAVAVSRHEGRMRSALPMKDSAAARAVGVRPPR